MIHIKAGRSATDSVSTVGSVGSVNAVDATGRTMNPSSEYPEMLCFALEGLKTPCRSMSHIIRYAFMRNRGRVSKNRRYDESLEYSDREEGCV